MAKKLMVQGTSSFAGKTLLVCALCRIFSEKGYGAAPFKAQNTSRNSHTIGDGREIAVAQVIQAFAAGVEPDVDMNPILLKPKGEGRSEVFVRGEFYRDIEASRYYEEFAIKEGLEIAKEALKNLEKKHDLIIIEGAGSPAEINLYRQDIANMRMAEIANAPVILVADIDRGGVFASIYGTIKLLEERHRNMIKGIVINKFRGDLEILRPGIEQIEKLVSKPVLGVLPFVHALNLPEEDSFSLEGDVAGEGAEDIWTESLERLSDAVRRELDMSEIERMMG